MSSRGIHCLVIADDLTGANEMGSAWVSGGHPVKLLLPGSPLWLPKEGELDQWPVVVVDTETRNLPASEAREVIKRFAADFAGITPSLVFKKIDSALRGPIGPEIAQVMESFGFSRAVVAPAFPAQHRTTIGGYQLINGVPVHLTPSALDARAPVRESHIPSLVEESLGQPAGVISVKQVESGTMALLEAVQGVFESRRICVIDAAVPEHLRTIAEAAVQLRPLPLLVGTFGLAQHLAGLGGDSADPQALPEALGSGRPASGILVVCGSQHPGSKAQVEELEARGWAVVYRLKATQPEPVFEKTVDGEIGEISGAVAGDVAAALSERSVVLAPKDDAFPESCEDPAAIASALGAIAAKACEVRRPLGLHLSGGETAYYVLKELGAHSIEIRGQIADGVPWGRIEGGPLDGTLVVTKSGSFGAPEAITEALAAMRSISLVRGGNDRRPA